MQNLPRKSLLTIYKAFLWPHIDYSNVIYDQWIFLWRAHQEKVNFRSSHPEVFLGKGVLKICSRFTGEHPCRSALSIKLQSNFIEITLRHGCSLVNLLHIFRTPASKNTSGGLLLKFVELDLESLNTRRWSTGLCYMFKIMKNQAPEYLNKLIPKRRQNFNSRISIF